MNLNYREFSEWSRSTNFKRYHSYHFNCVWAICINLGSRFLQNATMQVILISDGTYSYLMFNYDQEQWSLEPVSYAPSTAGYSLPDKTGFIMATNGNYSQLNKGTNVHPGNIRISDSRHNTSILN